MPETPVADAPALRQTPPADLIAERAASIDLDARADVRTSTTDSTSANATTREGDPNTDLPHDASKWAQPGPTRASRAETSLERDDPDEGEDDDPPARRDIVPRPEIVPGPYSATLSSSRIPAPEAAAYILEIRDRIIDLQGDVSRLGMNADLDEETRWALRRIFDTYLTPAAGALFHAAKGDATRGGKRGDGIWPGQVDAVAKRLHELVYAPWVATLVRTGALRERPAEQLQAIARLPFEELHGFGQDRCRAYARRALGILDAPIPDIQSWTPTTDRRMAL